MRSRVDLDAERDALVHGHRERLRAAHPAEAGGERDRARQRAAEAAARDLGEALVGALHDPLAADVDPRAGGHLPVHRQPQLLEAAELLPRRPLGHQVGVGDQHPRRPLVGAKDADRLARLHQQRLVVRRARAASGRSRRTPPTSAPRGRCRRRRRGRPGRSATSGSRLFISIRSAASCGQPRQESSVPRGARTSRAHASSPISASTAARSAPEATRRSDLRELGREPAVGPGPGRDRSRSAPRRRRRFPRPARAAARRSSPRAAHGQLDREDPGQVGDADAQLARRRPSPSRRGPPASRSSAASRRSPGRPGGGSRPPSPPACSGRSSGPS